MSQASAVYVKRESVRLKAQWDTAIVGLAVFLFHLWHVPSVAAGEIFRRSNLAFDFDINRFVALWCTYPFPASDNQDYYAVRHPLAVAVRLVCAPLVQAGLDARLAACGIAALCAAVCAMLTFKIARMLGVQRLRAYIVTILWTLSTTPLLLGVLPETYDLALIALALQFLLVIRWIGGQKPGFAALAAVAVANFGITITNVVLPALSALMCRLVGAPFKQALRGTIAFGTSAAALALGLSLASFLLWPVQNIGNPVSALKQVYWSAASAERTLERQSPGEVAWTFAVTSFVAPAPARYPSGAPENPYLWDIRGQNYSALGWAAVFGWLVLLSYGAVAAAKDKERWPLWGLAGLWIAFNIGLHAYWQFRDSVFLYAAHGHMAYFLVVLAGAASAQKQGSYGTLAYTGWLGVLTLLVGVNNLPVYLQLSQLN